MAFTANAFIANFESRLNWTGSHAWSHYRLARGTAWCAAEISYTFEMIGAKAKWYGGKPVFYVPYAQQWMAKNWKTVYDYRGKGSLKDAKKGDIVIFMWTRGSRDHIGAVYSDAKSGSQIRTIEGNTSGGKVDKRTRAKANIYAIYRPPWTTGKEEKYKGTFPTLPERGWFQRGDEGEQARHLQRLLNWATDYGLTVDGELGPKTVRAILAFQGQNGLKQDGGFGKECLKMAKKIKR